MKKILGLFISAFLVGNGVAMAQGVMDAYKLSQTDINGTARYLGMSGAFGALGGDVSVINSNPAGLGVFRSSEIVATVSLNMYNTNTDWTGITSSVNKTRFNLDNFAYVGYFPTGNDEGIVGWNVGFSYNRIKNFNRSYRMNGTPRTSLSDYVSEISYGRSESDLTYVKGGYDPYDRVPWLPVLGFESGWIEPTGTNRWGSTFGEYDENGNFQDYEVQSADLFVQERGGIDQYNFSFATNVSNIVFIGATFGVTDMSYRLRSFYDEDFGIGPQYTTRDYLYLENALSTDGTGYDFNLGVIVRPTDYLRLGVAYNSPTWYKMTDYYHAIGESNINDFEDPFISAETPERSYTDYKFRTPDKWIFSAAGVIGQSALISVDYELTNYKNARFHDVDGIEYFDENDLIKEDFKNASTVKVGFEYKVTPQFALRAGGAWQTASSEKYLQDGAEEVFISGTVPHYTVDRGMASYSVGFGYRFTPNFYMDMAYVFRQHKENAFAFSSAFNDDVENNYHSAVISEPASLKTNTNRIALTLGYKF